MRGYVFESLFALACGMLVRKHNEDVYEKMRALRDEAVAANQSKITFIAKMRCDHARITLVITCVCAR
jgi:hypothetical protein